MKARIFGCISCSLVVVGSLFACSTSSSSGTAGACGNLANALLAYSQRCGDEYDPARTNDLANRYTQLCQAELALPGAPDETSQLNACASALGGEPCNAGQVDACNFTPTGSLATGAACSDAEQCQSGACSTPTISISADGGTSNCGTCEAAIADGQPCGTTGSICVQGDTCTFSSDGGLQAETCQKKPTPGDVGATCASSTGCKSPNHCLFAVTNGNQSGTCAAPVASGGACTTSSDCVSGLACSGTTTRTCGTPVAQGGACLGGDCAAGLACDTTSQKCATITFGAAGAACDGTVTRCSHGNCVFAETPGGTGNAGTCPTIIADGQPCTSTSSNSPTQCDDFASCRNGKCTLAPATCN